MSKSVRIWIANTRVYIYKERLAEGKLLFMLPALGAAWGCNGEGFKGRPMRDHAEGPLGLPLERRFNCK